MYAIRSYYETTVKKRFIESLLKNEQLELKDSTRLVWVGENIDIVEDTLYIFDNLYQEAVNITGNEAEFINRITSYNVCYTKLLRALQPYRPRCTDKRKTG